MPAGRFGQDDDFAGWAENIQNLMDEMLRRSFVDFRSIGAWQPNANLFENAEAYFICIELAGVDENQIDVRCEDERHVLVRGLRKRPHRAEMTSPLRAHALEIDEGPFARTFDLPEPVDVDRIDAATHNGLVWIILPKRGEE